ncbi:phosphatase PAP2 family protein [Pontibacter fetidus]|uniref:Phosphatase PAP2 family protein n=1 Tax=Pontibacter fetidus TaxID=2700082 RepID=A0A6B2H479_9BACT|nr:phosphatase PAP2 family protein [Pontibacter fetidus]NDK56918.1 phosphatase PAP2 family protein [Pontibacter fetidus]
MKLTKLIAVHLFWMSVLASPVVAQAQEAPSKNTAQTILLADSAAAPADTVFPGQKQPFTEAQLKEGSNKRYLTRAVLPAAALIGAGIYTIQDNGFFSSHDARDARHQYTPNFSTKVDDYLLLLPAAYMFGFNAFSSQNRHDIRRQTGLLLASGVLTTAIVFPTKKLTNIDRPNGEPTAFPSGHTAYAFTIATIVDKEFRHKSPWVSVGSYTIASATGIMRVLNNEHWMADVLAGAGVGILSANAVYWLHDKFFKDKGYNNAVISPTVLPNGKPGMGMSLTF